MKNPYIIPAAMICAAILVAVWMLKPSVVQPPTGSFHDAVDEGYLEVVKQHLAASPNVNAKDVNGMTPLYIAAGRGHTAIAKLLIANGADVNAKDKDRSGSTPLSKAVIEGHNEIVELLIAKGADVNAKGGFVGGTPLHGAANKEIAELLIANDADVNAQDEDGLTPLDWAEKVYDWHSPEDKAAKKETADLLRKHGGKSRAEDSIFAAVMAGNIEAVKQHLAEGVDVNAKDGVGQTPLREAAFGGHKEIAELLIANGADVNAKDGYGFTPLHSAAYMGQKEIVELLIAKGADVNAKTDGGFAKPIPKEGQLGLHLIRLTPLDDAIRRKQTATADLLRKHGGKTGEELKAEGK